MRLAAFLLTIALLAVTLVNPPYPREQWLQHSATAIILGWLASDLRRRRLSATGFMCVLAFTALHIIGARWLYSMVPYESWLAAVGLPSPQQTFGWTRNHYDRLVHLAFGLLAVRPLADLLRPRATPVVDAIVLVTAMGAVYEIFEWTLAVMMSPAAAEGYNGQQGDWFDPQKDLALALAGSLAAAPLVRQVQRIDRC